VKEAIYEVLQTGITDTKGLPRDRKVFYKCLRCNGLVPSVPKDNVNCECGNIGIDKDMNRLWVGEYEKIAILKKIN
jgi:hypothetical protein